MEASMPYSHSPRVSQNSLRHAYALEPATPVHSPHHSIHSSTSSRTPIHTLSIHEYRKRQNAPTPTSQSGTPPGKTLRRKPAAPTLSGIERAPSISRTPIPGSRPPPRPLHFSASTHQLTAHQTLPPSPPHFVQQQSLAEPRDPGETTGSGSQFSGRVEHSVSFRSDSTGKVSSFKSIKRLPKPQPATSGATQLALHPPAFPPPPLAPVTSARSWLSPLRTQSYSDLETQLSSDAQTTPSTFSLSRFPQPPHPVDPSLSPPIDENAPPPTRLSNHTTTAPATPPATPAIIHYRGASFDLVNPHDSLLFHDIVTPSRDLDSSDYLLIQSPDDSEIMAPKRSLYGDLNAAYSSIAARHTEDSPNMNLPLPPVPAAFSPGSSEYSSPTFSFESNLAVSPLAVRKPPMESRFSLAQLTRSLTKKLIRAPEGQGQELQNLPIPRAATSHLEGQFPRPLDQSYPFAPITYSHPAFRTMEPASPMSPTSPFSLVLPDPERNSKRESDLSVEYPRFMHRVETEPLTSMVPDDPSTQVGRASLSESDLLSRPYYEDMASIYPGSSIYSHEGNDDTSGYPPSLHSKRKSNPFGPLSLDNGRYSNEYNRDSLYAYAPSNRGSRRASRPSNQTPNRISKPVGNENDKIDTISKFIDQYGPGRTTSSIPVTEVSNSEELVPAKRPRPFRNASGLSQFDFGLQDDDDMDKSDESVVPPIQPGRGKKPLITQVAGSPPRKLPTLAPAFEYDEDHKPLSRQQTSDIFSGASSYGDTRNLLQISPPRGAGSDPFVPPVTRPLLEPSSSYSQGPGQPKPLEPSSSYSQPSGQASPHTPQEALDHAENIFGEAAASNKDATIPAMLARRSSGYLLRSNRQSANSDALNRGGAEEEKGDWETVGSGNRMTRYSVGDSIADYSSSEDSRGSLGFTEDAGSLPVLDRDSSFYRHPSPLPPHSHPFSSSPPNLDTRISVQTAPDESSSSNELTSSPPISSTLPLFRTRNLNPDQHSNADQPYRFAPWTTPGQYTMSDKETQELLNSGPNDEILYEYEEVLSDPISASSPQQETPGVVRENSFEKFSLLGPKGNLTGTPLGTGMHEVGSSVADTSSPGAQLSSSPYERLGRPLSGFPGFYVTPGRTASVNRIRTSHLPSTPPTPADHDRSPSEVTLFPNRWNAQAPPEPSPTLEGRRKSLKLPKTPTSPGRRGSRVHGQTKLRDMILAPDPHTANSSQATHISHFMPGHSARPSTANTHTPLRLTFSEVSLKPNLANEHSPHLLCPERALNPQDEEERWRTSWIIFGVFCLLPPLLILYRWLADYAIVALTKGRLGHCSERPKRIALGAGIIVNVSLVSLILIPVLVAHAVGAV